MQIKWSNSSWSTLRYRLILIVGSCNLAYEDLTEIKYKSYRSIYFTTKKTGITMKITQVCNDIKRKFVQDDCHFNQSQSAHGSWKRCKCREWSPPTSCSILDRWTIIGCYVTLVFCALTYPKVAYALISHAASSTWRYSTVRACAGLHTHWSRMQQAAPGDAAPYVLLQVYIHTDLADTGLALAFIC